MEDYRIAYERWLNDKTLEPDLRKELLSLSDQKDIEDRFFRRLEFGTGGLRGVIGVGINRINLYMVRWATEGLARYLAKYVNDAKEKGVVIAYDSRQMSKEFAEAAGCVLANHGIHVYLFPELRPTPMLSFAVRHLQAAGGIVLTASHNPPEYNGLKMYGEDGGQITSNMANQIWAEMESIKNELTIKTLPFEDAIQKELVQFLGDEMDTAYTKYLLSLSLCPETIKQISDDFRIVYTPIHGSGNKPVRRILKEAGFSLVDVVPEQELPDPLFSTVSSPNPEEKQAFALAIQLAQQVHADIVLGTDPDADRVGIVVKDQIGEYRVLNGNQTGALLLQYLLEQKKQLGQLPENGVLLKTIVTSELGRVIASAYNLTTVDTLTGFKYIGEKIREYETTGAHTFLFGYEESYGYLIGDFVRDKDAVQACLLACEMAAYYKTKGRSLNDVLEQIYETYGYYQEDLLSLTFKGREGQERLGELMEKLRKNPFSHIGNSTVSVIKDYLLGIDDLPKANVLKYVLSDGSWIAIRPSGTEPKMKVYLSAMDKHKDVSEVKLRMLKDFVGNLLKV